VALAEQLRNSRPYVSPAPRSTRSTSSLTTRKSTPCNAGFPARPLRRRLIASSSPGLGRANAAQVRPAPEQDKNGHCGSSLLHSARALDIDFRAPGPDPCTALLHERRGVPYQCLPKTGVFQKLALAGPAVKSSSDIKSYHFPGLSVVLADAWCWRSKHRPELHIFATSVDFPEPRPETMNTSADALGLCHSTFCACREFLDIDFTSSANVVIAGFGLDAGVLESKVLASRCISSRENRVSCRSRRGEQFSELLHMAAQPRSSSVTSLRPPARSSCAARAGSICAPLSSSHHSFPAARECGTHALGKRFNLRRLFRNPRKQPCISPVRVCPSDQRIVSKRPTPVQHFNWAPSRSCVSSLCSSGQAGAATTPVIEQRDQVSSVFTPNVPQFSTALYRLRRPRDSLHGSRTAGCSRR